MSSKEIAFIKAGEVEIRGTDNDTLKTISDQSDTMETNLNLSIGTSELNIRGTNSDTLKTISDKIDGFSILTTKEKSLLGAGSVPGFQDFFNIGTHLGDPDINYWSTFNLGADKTFISFISPADEWGQTNCCECQYGAGGTAYSHIVYSKDKFNISLKSGITEVHFKTEVRLDWGASDSNQAGLGLIENERVPAEVTDFRTPAYEVATFSVLNQVVNAWSSDGVNVENTDLSAYVTAGTYFTGEIVITSSDVKFYIEDVLRATHTTYVPSTTWQIVMGAQDNEGGNYVYTKYVQVWGE